MGKNRLKMVILLLVQSFLLTGKQSMFIVSMLDLSSINRDKYRGNAAFAIYFAHGIQVVQITYFCILI